MTVLTQHSLPVRPLRIPERASLVIDTLADYVTFPNGSLRAPTTVARDFIMIAFGRSPAGTGSGVLDTFLSSSSNSVRINHSGAPGNQKKMVADYSSGTPVFNNPTFRGGSNALVWGPEEPFVYAYHMINGVPGWAAKRGSDGASVYCKGDSLFVAGSALFNGLNTAMVNRVSNELVVTYAFHSRSVGEPVLFPGIGVRLVTAVVDVSTFKCADVGANGSGVAAGFCVQNSVWTSNPILFSHFGQAYNGVNGWLQGCGGLFSMRHAEQAAPGGFAALLDGDGYLLDSWLESLIDGSYIELPGTNFYTVNVGDPDSAATGTAAATAGNPTWHGGERMAAPIAQPPFLAPVRSDLHNMVHPLEHGLATGTVSIDFTSTGPGLPRDVLARLWDGDPDEAGATLLIDWTLVCAAEDIVDGLGLAQLHEVPINHGYWLTLAPRSIGNRGLHGHQLHVPASVGPKFGRNQQSLYAVALGAFADTTSGTPVTIPDGLATLSSTWGTAYPNAGISSPGRSVSHKLVGTADLFASSLREMAKIGLAELDTALGRPGAFGVVNMARSGHNKRDQALDGREFTLTLGTATPGVPLTGIWNVPGSSNKWPEPWTVIIKRDGVTVGTDDFASATGTLGNTSAPLTGTVTGSINYDTGAYSITSASAGVITMTARMAMSSLGGTGSSRANYGNVHDGNLYSYMGIPNIKGTSDIGDNLIVAGPLTEWLDDWTWSDLTFLGVGVSDAAAKAWLETSTDMLEESLALRDAFRNPRTGAMIPILRSPQQRITNLPFENQRSRYIMEQIAEERGEAFLAGCLTQEIDAQFFDHPIEKGKIQLLVHDILAVLSYHGLTEKDHHTIRRLESVTRLSGNVLRLQFTVDPNGIGQHDPAATFLAGLYYGATAASTYVTPSTFTYSINSAGCYVDITKTSGNWASGYYDINCRDAVPSTVGTLADEGTHLKATLCYLTGGYPAFVSRRGVDVHYAKARAGIQVT